MWPLCVTSCYGTVALRLIWIQLSQLCIRYLNFLIQFQTYLKETFGQFRISVRLRLGLLPVYKTISPLYSMYTSLFFCLLDACIYLLNVHSQQFCMYLPLTVVEVNVKVREKTGNLMMPPNQSLAKYILYLLNLILWPIGYE